MQYKPQKQFTKKNFVKWLKKQPVSRSFKYNSPTDCANASFIKESGQWKPNFLKEMLYSRYEDTNFKLYPLPNWARNIVLVAKSNPNHHVTVHDLWIYMSKLS